MEATPVTSIDHKKFVFGRTREVRNICDLKRNNKVHIRHKGAHQQGKLRPPLKEVPRVVLEQPISGIPNHDIQNEGTQAKHEVLLQEPSVSQP